jgi:hypothetical protein
MSVKDGKRETYHPEDEAIVLAMRAQRRQTELDRDLWQAAYDGNAKKVADLLERGADPKKPNSGASDSTPLMAAAQSASLEALEMLLPHNEVDQKDAHGTTALMWAAYACRPEAIKSLLAAGADPLAKDKLGRSALHKAALRNFEATMAILATVSDLDALDNEGQSAEQLARASFNANRAGSSDVIGQERARRESAALREAASERLGDRPEAPPRRPLSL